MANKAKRRRRLWDAYAFPGFRPQSTARGVFGDPKARVITLVRRSKNALRELRTGAQGLVRRASAPHARPVLRRCAHLPRIRGAAPAVQELRHSEARAPGVSCRQSVLRQALCPLRGPALPIEFGQGHCLGVQSRLMGHGQGDGKAVHGGAVGEGGHARTQGNRHRRGAAGRDAADMPAVAFHTMRHCGNSWLAQLGVAAEMRARLGGWSVWGATIILSGRPRTGVRLNSLRQINNPAVC